MTVKLLKRWFVIANYLGFTVIFFSINRAYSQILPTPMVFQSSGEPGVSIADEISIDPSNLTEQLKDYLTKELSSRFGCRVIYSKAGRHLNFKPLVNVPQDQYSININDKISISFSSEASCFYAINSLFQLVKEEEKTLNFEQCFVMDQPKFQWRGMHLDVSRHFFTIEEVKRYIDLISFYKFNTFHWHLTDDQGWRIEIKKYPKLTEIGAFRDSTLDNHYSTRPRTFTKERYGGFYTQEEIKEVVKYAESRFVTIVPEIEMPGHARAALAAYPELSCTGEQHGVEGLWGVFDDIFCSQASTIDFLQDVLTEVIALFPSKYIHIGGDEAPKTRWKECAKCQKTISENNLKDEHELQSWFVRQMDAFLTKNGRSLIGWDEILEGGLSPNAAVMSWRGFEGGIEAAKQGHYVVMSPGSHCYFDHYQSKNSKEPLAFGGFTPLKKVYEFSPITKEMSSEQQQFVLGGQANLWTEYIPDFKQVEYMLFPRAIALAQALWCENKPSYEQFLGDLKSYHLPELTRKKVNWSKAIFYPEMKLKRSQKGVTVDFSSTIGDVHVSQNGKNAANSVDLDRINRHTVLPNTFFVMVDENQVKVVSEYTIFQHQSLGLPIEFITKPNERYNANGELNLVDGILGTLPWKGSDWTGWNEQEIRFIIDLGAKKQIDSLEINFLEDIGSWIHLPASVRFSVSKDQKKWKYIESADIETYADNVKKGKFLLYGSTINKKGRYLKVLITTFDVIPDGLPGANHVAWTFIDELILFSK
ncbi:MAG: family 20 glycosylhydrolase [Bacteroidota bacterium]